MVVKIKTSVEIEEKTIPFDQLAVDDIVMYRMTHWSLSTSYEVKIKYIGDRYIISENTKTKEEKVCNYYDYDCYYAPVFMRT